ncbi:HAMP domain-containing sensor histidine kinase [Clostridium sp. Ade.TY]|uniref:sensor histidine kinase n=1 Tax=Clostridium sp. Ade.TY TaxID=1391647 RepID=UPI0004078EC3|nr:HAMP domain-containing sensor histidine kinase [Clostridium sp. Ade.TY]
MKKHSLAYRLIITFTLIVVIALVIVAGVLSLWIRQNYFDQKKDQLNRESNIIESAAISYLSLDKSSNLTTLNNVMNFVSKTIDAEILVTDNLGYTYAVSNSIYENYKFSNIGIPKEDMDVLKQGKSIEYGNVKSSSQNNYVYLKPIFNKDYFSGVIIMIVPTESMLAPIIDVNEVIWGTALVVIIIGGIFVYFYSKKSLVKPIDQITAAARRISKGGVDERLDINQNNEIGELAESFNIMAESLQTVDDNRRAFISNVSHELRSPITSIKGFISGILDGVIPRDKEGYYLKIVYEETDRLSRLINDLLDISALESGKINLNKQEIDISNILRYTIAKFESAINQKGLNVEVVLEQEHQYVIGDNDKITQVVTNLIDNAVKYSRENGNIRINTRSKGDRVFVSIYNDGELLSKEQLIKIWDRFYKADVSRTNKVSTGLGLPIVRLILTEHGEDIWVENYKDTGVMFTFTLIKK